MLAAIHGVGFGGRPLIAHVEWADGNGHFVVIDGPLRMPLPPPPEILPASAGSLPPAGTKLPPPPPKFGGSFPTKATVERRMVVCDPAYGLVEVPITVKYEVPGRGASGTFSGHVIMCDS